MKLKLIRMSLLVIVAVSGALIVSGQDTGVYAEPIQQANMRALPGVDAELVGEIFAGTRYPVIGRSEFFPWVLLGDPDTLRPIGWVFNDLLNFTGNADSVPFSSTDITTLPDTPPTIAPELPDTSASGDEEAPGPTLTPEPTQPTFNVTGITRGPINIRYGPSVNQPILGRAQMGDRFEVLAYHTQFPWVQVYFANSPNERAWIALELLDIEGDLYSLTAISDTSLNLPVLTPTPRIQQSLGLPGIESTTLSPAFLALGDHIWDRILEAGFDPATERFGAVYLQDLQTGEALTFGNEYAFSGTSIIKIAILMEYYAMLAGQPNPQEAVDIANTMICSENVATNRLLSRIGNGDDLLGAERLTQSLRELGLDNTFLTAPFQTTTAGTPTPLPRAIQYPVTDVDQSRANPNPTSQLTVEEMGWLLSGVYQCAYEEDGPLISHYSGALSGQECRRMLHIMSNNTVDGLLKAGVPENILVAHKHGWIEDTHGNAGVFFTPGGDYVLVMMLYTPTWLVFTESLPLLADVSRIVYNHYNPDEPQEFVREGYIPPVGECNYRFEDDLVAEILAPDYLRRIQDAPYFIDHQQLFIESEVEQTPEATLPG